MSAASSSTTRAWSFATCLLLVAVPSLAGAQDAQLGRAGQEFFSQCPDLSGCEGTICGQRFTWDGVTMTLPDVGASGRITSTGDPEAQRMADILNAYCGVAPGDGILGSAGILSNMERQLAGVGRSGRGAPAGIGGGGVAEVGESTYGVSLPLDYSFERANGGRILANGVVALGKRENLTQVALSANPGLSWVLGSPAGSRRFALGAFTPLAFSYGSVAEADAAITYGLGLGGIAVATLETGPSTLSAGASAAPRWTSAGPSLPLGALARFERPVTAFVDGFLSASFGEDLVAEGANVFAAGTGVTIAGWEIGYRAILGQSYEAHTIGVLKKETLAGAETLKRETGAGGAP